VAVDVAREGVVIPLAVARVRDIVRAVCRSEGVDDAMISVTFVTNRAIAKMNREFLGHRGATDVITFQLQTLLGSNNLQIGDIYIAPDVARANARSHGVRVREELVRLIIHGTLHVIGYNHPDGDERTGTIMWSRQEALVAVLS
jgi:probable rRNA maturation factor